MSPSATKVLSRIEALRGAAKAGVLSSEEAGGEAGWDGSRKMGENAGDVVMIDGPILRCFFFGGGMGILRMSK